MASAGYLLCTILSPKHVVRIPNEHTHGQEMMFILQDLVMLTFHLKTEQQKADSNKVTLLHVARSMQQTSFC